MVTYSIGIITTLVNRSDSLAKATVWVFPVWVVFEQFAVNQSRSGSSTVQLVREYQFVVGLIHCRASSGVYRFFLKYSAHSNCFYAQNGIHLAVPNIGGAIRLSWFVHTPKCAARSISEWIWNFFLQILLLKFLLLSGIILECVLSENQWFLHQGCHFPLLGMQSIHIPNGALKWSMTSVS